MKKPMDRVECTKRGTAYFLAGREVSEADYRREYPRPKGLAGPEALVKFPALKSVAMAVNPGQVEEARAADKKNGVEVEYTPGGRPIYTSSRQMREHCRANGFVHHGY